MVFNLELAKEQGYSDEEVATFLSKKHGFDLGLALDNGYDYGSVAGYLSQKEDEPETTFGEDVMDAIKRPAAGFARTALMAGRGAIEDADAVTNLIGLDDLISDGEDNAAVNRLNQAQQGVDGWVDPSAGHFDQFLEGVGSASAFLLALAISPGAKARKAVHTAKGLKNLFAGEGKVNALKTLAKGYSSPLAFAGATGAGEQAGMVDQARQQGIDVSQGQEDLATAMGTLTGFTELAPIERLMKGIGAPVAKGLMPRLKRALITGGAEGVQELTARLMQDLTAKGIYNPDLPVGESAWQEFVTGGEVGAALDLVFGALSSRRAKAITNQQKEMERRVRAAQAESERQASTQFDPVVNVAINPDGTQTALPYLPPEGADLNDPRSVAESGAAQIESTLGERFPTTGWQVGETKLPDGQTVFHAMDSEGNQYGPDNPDPQVARSLVGALTERGINRAVHNSAAVSVDSSPNEYAPAERNRLIAFGMRLFHPASNLFTAEQVNVAAGHTVDNGYAHETLSLEDAEAAKIPVNQMTAAQQINRKRRAAGQPVSNMFTAEEVRSALGNNFGRLNQTQLVPIGANERFEARTVNGKPVVAGILQGKGKKKKKIDSGEVIGSRPSTDLNKADRVEFKNIEEAENYAEYLNKKAESGTLMRSDLMADTDIKVNDLRRLLKQKKIESDLNSPAVRRIAELVTGRKRGSLKKINELKPGEKSLLYNKLKTLPEMEQGTHLPEYGLSPYTRTQQQAAKQQYLKDGTLPSREALGKLSARAYAKLTKDIKNDAATQAERAAVLEKEQQAEKEAEQQKEEQESVEGLVLGVIEDRNLRDLIKAKVTDVARQTKLDADGNIVIGERTYQGDPNKERSVEGKFARSMNSVFLHLEALKTNPDYLRVKNKEGVTQKELDEKLTELALETLDHELLHAMRNADLFTDTEWKMLQGVARQQKIPGTDQTYLQRAKRAYRNADPDTQMEEAIAEVVRDGIAGRLKIGGPQKNLLRRIVDFIKGMVGIKSEGYESFDDVIRAIKSGEVGSRERGKIRTLRLTSPLTQEVGPDGSVIKNTATAPSGGRKRADYESRRGPFVDEGVIRPLSTNLPLNMEMRAWHGSPHAFTLFDLNRVGTGEGVIAQGWGMYFGQRESTAEWYAETVKHAPWLTDFMEQRDQAGADEAEKWFLLSVESGITTEKGQLRNLDDVLGEARQMLMDEVEYSDDVFMAGMARRALNKWDEYTTRLKKAAKGKHHPGTINRYLYEVEIPDETVEKLLDWNASLRDQPKVLSKLRGYFSLFGTPDEVMRKAGITEDSTGAEIYWRFSGEYPTFDAQKDASLTLRAIDILGVRYTDSASARSRNRTVNMVLFDMKGVEIVKRNGVPIDKIGVIKEQVPGADRLQKAAGITDNMLSVRLERAEEQGFNTNTVWYNGSRRPKKRFRSRRGAQVYVTLDPWFAYNFTYSNLLDGTDWSGGDLTFYEERGYQSVIHPLFIRVKNTFDARNSEHLSELVKYFRKGVSKEVRNRMIEQIKKNHPKLSQGQRDLALRGWMEDIKRAFSYMEDGLVSWSQIESVQPFIHAMGYDSHVDYEEVHEPATGLAIYDPENVKGIFANFDPESVPEGARYGDDIMYSRRSDESANEHSLRLGRARRLGFDTDTVYYHGTKELFDEFKAKYPDGLIFFSTNPKMASDWGYNRSVDHGLGGTATRNQWTAYDEARRQKWRDEFPEELKGTNGFHWTEEQKELYDEYKANEPMGSYRAEKLSSSMVYPVFLRTQKTFDPRTDYGLIEPLLLSGDMPGTGWDQIVAQGNHKNGNWLVYENDKVISFLRNRGYDSIWLRESALEGEPHETIAIFDPSQARSIFAEFKEDTPNTTDIMYSRRETDPAAIDRAVAENKSEAEQSAAIHWPPRYSTDADPEAQYIARHPEAARTEGHDVSLSMREPTYSSPSVAAAIDSVSGHVPDQRHPMAHYATLGALDEPSTFQYMMTKWKQNAINRYARLEHLNWSTELRENLADSSSIASALHADRAMGLAAASIRYGVPVYHNGWVFVVNQKMADDLAERGEPLNIPGLDLSSVKSLIEVNAPLHSKEYGDLTRLAKSYAIAMRSHRLTNEGKRVPVTPEFKQEILSEVELMVDPGTGENIIKRWYKDWQDYNEHVINLMQDTGVLTPETADMWREAADYFPFYRVAEGATGEMYRRAQKVFGGMTGAIQLRRLKGGTEPVNMDLEEAMSLNLTAAIQMSMKNVAQQRIVRDLKQLNLAQELLPGQSSIAPVVEFRVNGKKRRAAIFDPLVYESMQSLSSTDLVSMVRNTVGKPATWLRELVTRDPGFMLVNLLRDSMSSFVTSGANLTPLYSTFKGLFDGVETLEMMGVVGGYDYSNDPDDLKKFHRDELIKAGVEDGTAINMFTRMWDWLGRGTTASDAATRNAVFDDVYARTGNFAEASFQAMEVINFGRHGLHPAFRILGAVVPFLNARFQGLDVFWRAFKGHYSANKALTREQIVMAAITRGSLLMGSTLAYYMLFGGDDQYKEQPAFVKDNYWIIPTPWGTPITIPIPFEVGLMFKTVPENVIAHLLSGKETKDGDTYDVRTGRDMAQSAVRNVGATLEISPFQIQFIGPIAEAMLNYNQFTGRQIVPQYMIENVEPGAQKEPYTHEAAKWIGEKLNVSPIRLQHAAEGYAGTMGVYLFDLIDLGLKSETLRGDTEAVMPKTPWYNYPVIKRFAGDPHGRGMVQDAYEIYKEVTKVHNTLNMLRRDGKLDEAKAYVRNRQVLLSMKGNVNSVKRILDSFRKQRDRIMRSDRTAEQKRQLTDQLDRRLNQVLKKVVPKLKAKANLPAYTPYIYPEN